MCVIVDYTVLQYIVQTVEKYYMGRGAWCCMYSTLQALREYYSEEGAETGPCLEVAFDKDEVALEVEEDGVTLDNGWSLVPLVLPTSVRKCTKCIFVHIS